MSALSSKAKVFTPLSDESSDEELDFTIISSKSDKAKAKAAANAKLVAKLTPTTRADLLATCARRGTPDHYFTCRKCKLPGVQTGEEADDIKSKLPAGTFRPMAIHKWCKESNAPVAKAPVVEAPAPPAKAPVLSEFPVFLAAPPKPTISKELSALRAQLKQEEAMLATELAYSSAAAARKEAEASEIAELTAKIRKLKADRLAGYDAKTAEEKIKKPYADAAKPTNGDAF
jgi:hypothetical protein